MNKNKAEDCAMIMSETENLCLLKSKRYLNPRNKMFLSVNRSFDTQHDYSVVTSNDF